MWNINISYEITQPLNYMETYFNLLLQNIKCYNHILSNIFIILICHIVSPTYTYMFHLLTPTYITYFHLHISHTYTYIHILYLQVIEYYS